jgi:ceramide glucosyltransferase
LIPVSILKPLKGSDSGMFQNLETFFKLDYPKYELLFSVADDKDPALLVVRRLIKKYPNVSAQVIVGAVNVGVNPKVNNMIRSYDRARHDWILISDSNVRVNSKYLKNLVGHIENDTGMVSSVVTGVQPSGLGAKLDVIYLNSFYLKGMVFADACGHPCAVGKSMLFRKSTAERFGGLRVLGRYLAEDYMAGEAMRNLGLKVLIATEPVEQFIGTYTFRDFWNRHIRWGRIRKVQSPIIFFTEPLLGVLVSGIIGSIAVSEIWGIEFSPIFMAHMFFNLGLDYLVHEKLGRPFLWFHWGIRELISFPLWLHTALGNTVLWRGKHYVVKPGGLLEIPDAEIEPSYAKILP